LRYNSVLFDLDGTLIDNSEGIHNGFRYALKKLGCEEWEGKMPDVIGPPLRSSFSNYFGLNAVQTEEAARLYREYYQPTGVYEYVVYPHVMEMLETLHAAGASIYIATVKPRVFAEILLNHKGLMKYFSAVVGSELDGTLDKKPDIIRHLLDNYMPKSHLPAVMVGDRWHDAKGAQDVGLDFAGALWGFGGREEFLPYGCVKGMFADVRALCGWLMGEAGE
jgi:phosphoglycolate phosphatase